MALSNGRQLAFLRKVWGGTTQGYVFLPWLPGHLETKAERKKRGSWQEVCFKWPEQQEQILQHLNEHEADDLYFCPNIFEAPHRTSEALDFNQRVLYADLDEVDPDTIDRDYRPTVAWQTSDDRYQAVWLLSQNEIGLSEEGNENHRLTYYVGADKNGWDCTQLLRVPGRINHKPGKKGQQGVMLWENGPVYAVDDFKDLPAVRVVSAHDDIDDAILDSIDRKAVWRGVRMKVSTRCRDYMSIRDPEVAQDAAESFPEGMSGLLWYVERELADAGLSVAEIVSIIRPMVWNKFAGRADELVRLKSEAAKAVGVTRDGGSGDGSGGDGSGSDGALEVLDELSSDLAVDLDVFLAQQRRRPSWLVDKIWPDGAVGFIAGSPKSYKSWVGLDLAVSIATGTPFLGVYKVKQSMVIYIQEEDGETEVEDRLHKVFAGKPPETHPWGWMQYVSGDAGNGQANGPGPGMWWMPCEGERFMRVMVRKGLDLTDVSWQGLLAELCEEYEPGMVIIDTLGTSAGDIDIDKSREVNKALKPLKVLSSEYGCAIAIVHHFSKSGGGSGAGGNGQGGGSGGSARGGAKMLGSVALHAWVETALYVSDKRLVSDGVWSVRVDRECKRAMDLGFDLEVPEIRRGGGWAPAIVKRDVSDTEGAEVKERVNGQVKKANGRVPVWVHLARNLVAGGVNTESRARTVQEIVDVYDPDKSRQAMLSKLNQGVDHGCIIKDESGAAHTFWVDKKLLENDYARG